MTDKIKSKYGSIDGLRVIACIGIILMHVMTNINYELNDKVFCNVINEFTNFVFLFMVISSFCLCCGYYEKIKNNIFDYKDFYKKRIIKILPFFTFLVLLDILIDFNMNNLIEGFADITLMFGFLQKDMQVIGVAWFIGLIFIFYFIFPFFVYLFSNKKSAIFTTLIAVLMNFSCVYYFNVSRGNMYYSFVYFCIGALLYLYKDDIIKFFSKSKFLGISIIILSIVLYFILPFGNGFVELIKYSCVSISLLIYAISYDSIFLDNKFMKIIGSLSFEMYLCHMLIFRCVEKIGFVNVAGENFISYLFVVVIVFCGSILFSSLFKKVVEILKKKVIK